MKVKLARFYGFCSGVKASIKLAEQNPGSFIVGGEIIHNPLETDRLAKDFDVTVQSDYTQLKKGDTGIIRAHGVTPEIEQHLLDNGVSIVDATCPNVKDVQLQVKFYVERGYHIILLGDKTHPEVQGLVGYAGVNNITVVKNQDEARELVDESGIIPQSMAILSQTTKDTDTFNDLATWAFEKTHHGHCCPSNNTICPATAQKQIAARELAQTVDVGIVVGGRNSSNTRTLVNTMLPYCNTQLVEHVGDVEELAESGYFEGSEICGLTAGSSTPDYSIEEVKEFLEGL